MTIFHLRFTATLSPFCFQRYIDADGAGSSIYILHLGVSKVPQIDGRATRGWD